MRTPSTWRRTCALLGATTLAASGLAVAAVLGASPAGAAPSSITVSLAGNTGALKYGATGFLYGLGDEGTPSDNLVAPLRPQVTAQKAPDGLQHPNGDAIKVAPSWKRNGGKDIQIYMQDIYKNFPYEQLGIDDYLAKVDTMVRKVVADPNRASFVYVPFNEPDGIWYGSDVAGLCRDYVKVFNKIRSIDPTARIAGPNYSSYNSAAYRQFFTCARDNNALPQVTTWHELQDSFFTSWYSHYNDYRQIERDLGISPREISINEYGRINGDLGVPGNLVQFVSKFETSKVDGSLAYWTTAGSLNDLAVPTENNRATGGWWLYKLYGDMTGNTVPVTLPSQEGPLQAIASYDASKQQARVLLGGNQDVNGTYDTDVTLTGLASTPFASSAHVTVYGVDTTGLNPSSGPYVAKETDITTSNGSATISLTGLKGASAYYAIVTPNRDTNTAVANRYEAEYQRLSGSAKVTYGGNTGYSGTYFVEGYGGSNNASTDFVVNAANDGYYNVALRYAAGPYSGAPTNRSLRLALNGTNVQDVALPGTANWNTWNTVTTKLFLQAGINRISYKAYTNDDSDAANIDYIDVAPTTGTVSTIEAEATGNTLAGTARRDNNSGASGGSYVGYVGQGAGNTLRFNNVSVPTAGRYSLVIKYANGEFGGAGGGTYNTNVVDRFADVSINGGATQRIAFRNTGSFSNFPTTTAFVNLAAGSNTITFGNASAYAPDLDLIRVAATVG